MSDPTEPWFSAAQSLLLFTPQSVASSIMTQLEDLDFCTHEGCNRVFYYDPIYGQFFRCIQKDVHAAFLERTGSVAFETEEFLLRGNGLNAFKKTTKTESESNAAGSNDSIHERMQQELHSILHDKKDVRQLEEPQFQCRESAGNVSLPLHPHVLLSNLARRKHRDLEDPSTNPRSTSFSPTSSMSNYRHPSWMTSRIIPNRAPTPFHPTVTDLDHDTSSSSNQVEHHDSYSAHNGSSPVPVTFKRKMDFTWKRSSGMAEENFATDKDSNPQPLDDELTVAEPLLGWAFKSSPYEPLSAVELGSSQSVVDFPDARRLAMNTTTHTGPPSDSEFKVIPVNNAADDESFMPKPPSSFRHSTIQISPGPQGPSQNVRFLLPSESLSPTPSHHTTSPLPYDHNDAPVIPTYEDLHYQFPVDDPSHTESTMVEDVYMRSGSSYRAPGGLRHPASPLVKIVYLPTSPRTASESSSPAVPKSELLEPQENAANPRPDFFATSHLDAHPHRTFWLTDGNAIFRVEDTLFRVHRYFFERFSARLRSLIPSHSLSNDVHTVGPILLPNTTATDMERFLTLFYPSDFGDHDLKSLDEWFSAFTVASRWGFESIRTLAISKMYSLASGVDKVVLGKEFEIDSWLMPGYKEICLHSEPLTLAEGRRLGLEDVIRIGKIRHMIFDHTLKANDCEVMDWVKNLFEL